jgi:hypothetical protein
MFLRSYFTFNIILLFLLVCSCKQSIVNRDQLIKFINDPDNGLKKSQQVGNIDVEMIFKPYALIMSEKKVNNRKVLADSLKKEFVFEMRISANKKELLKQLAFAQYSLLVQTLSFEMNDFIRIIPDKNKPLQPKECLFDQTYGLTDANRLYIIFNKSIVKDADKLSIKVNEFGLNTGDLIFEFNVNDLTHLPNIIKN